MQAKQPPATTMMTTSTTPSTCDPVVTLPTGQTVRVVPVAPGDEANLRRPDAAPDDAADEAGYGYGV